MSVENPPVEETTNTSGDGSEGNQETPSYESFQKVLGEKKKATSRVKDLEDELREIKDRLKKDEETALAEQNRFKDLYTSTKQDLETLTQKLIAVEEEKVNARKMRSFLDSVKADIPRQYWGLVDLDKITIDGDEVDDFSVQKYVETFRQTYPDIVRPKETRRLPNDSPDASDSTLTYERWLALPLKERNKRYKEMRENDLKR